MNEVVQHPLITWLILVYDRTADVRFPLKRRWYRFNYNRATREQIQEILELCGFGRGDLAPGSGDKPGLVTASLSSRGNSDSVSRIIQHRHLFDYVADWTQLASEVHECGAFAGVPLPPETYYEDENEQRISIVEMFDEEMKRKRGDGAIAIVIDEPASVLRVQPATPVRGELWQPTDAELFGQLSSVANQLMRSRWLQSPCNVTFTSESISHVVLPVREDCMAVVLPFRQLYSKNGADDLFNRCCKIHNRHCPQEHPAFDWVCYYKSMFNRALAEPVGLPSKSCMPLQRYLDAFAYGAKLVHASPKSEPIADLDELLASDSKEFAVMAYHFALRTLLGYVTMAIPVMRHNIRYWTGTLHWSSPPQAAEGLFELGGVRNREAER